MDTIQITVAVKNLGSTTAEFKNTVDAAAFIKEVYEMEDTAISLMVNGTKQDWTFTDGVLKIII